ncbi:CGNR zinc finger domain-containing protein [Ornithinimicrobium panacihumi]|uniref:CGNR zinc finger domain-containing protein n=1 Tax=Ornithinimicrobium panacihumi TaxID=2008449 RepID=UPI003F8C5293
MTSSVDSDTGQWLIGSDGVRWFFDSGALSLDFGYTGDYGHGVKAWEHLHAPADLASWLHTRFISEIPDGHTVDVNPELFAQALRLRAAITRIARAITEHEKAQASDVDAVNIAAAQVGVPRLLDGGAWRPSAPGVEAMLATIALDAITALSTAGRVKQCAAEDCRLIFFDTSRPGTRRWCSMQRCGNRAKTRAHYARHHD